MDGGQNGDDVKLFETEIYFPDLLSFNPMCDVAFLIIYSTGYSYSNTLLLLLC